MLLRNATNNQGGINGVDDIIHVMEIQDNAETIN